MTRLSNLLLFTLVFTLAAADWLSAPTIAQEGASNAPPDRVPAGALLTGATLQRANVEGLDIELEGAPGQAYVLAFHNPTSEPLVADYEVDCVVQTGSPLARMAPIPTVVHTQRVEVTVPAGGRVRLRLEADAAPPASDDTNAGLGFGSFTTTSFRLRRAGADATASPLAVLRWASSPLDAG